MDSIFIVRKSLIYLGYVVLFINVILYSITYKQKSVAYKYLYFFLLLSLIIQIISSYLAFKKINNLFFFHVFTIGQYILMSLFFSTVLNNQVIKTILKYSCVIFPLTLIVVFCFKPELLFRFNSIEILIFSIPLIISSFSFFIEKIDSKNKKYIYFNSGFFLYLVCSTLLFSAGNIQTTTTRLLWLLNSFIYLCYQILIAVEWNKSFRNNKKIEQQV
ncbi:hypothetical protein OBPA_25940 [Polaribacter sp. OB-PA-B3]